MPKPTYSATVILLALNILPTLVNGYNCNLSNNQCSQGGDNDLSGYSLCMVRQYSVSVFIQCASQPNVPDFTTTDDDGGQHSISALNILTNAVSSPACSVCPLATNLQKAANGHGSVNFATYLCDQFHPVDAGICCLRNCLLAMPVEHSIKDFCADAKRDLMNEPTLPQSCGGDSSGGAGNEDSGDKSSGDKTSSGAASSNDNFAPTETVATSTSAPTQSSLSSSSTVSTTSSTASTSGTGTSSTTQATPGTGAASRKGVPYLDHLTILGLAVLPILVVFF